MQPYCSHLTRAIRFPLPEASPCQYLSPGHMLRFIFTLLPCFYLSLMAGGAQALPNFSDSEIRAARDALLHVKKRQFNEAEALAKRSGNEAVIALTQWQLFRHSDSKPEYADILRFLERYPDWPDQSLLQIKAEQALMQQLAPSELTRSFFAKREPISGRGRIALVRGLPEGDKRIPALVKEAWIKGDFDRPEEEHILARYGNFLSREEHIARTDRLLWEEKLSAARRMLPKVGADYRALFEARIALMGRSGSVNALINKVPATLKRDAGLIYERMRWRSRKGLDEGVREMLLAAPSTVPYPEKWWRDRAIQARDAIEAGNYGLAKQLLANHAQTDGYEKADALWLSGWLKYAFLNDAKSAYKDFFKLYKHVNFPVSKSRGAFWAGMAAERNGNADISKRWFKKAAKHSTTFYGQLALEKLGEKLSLPSMATPSDSDRVAFDNRPIVKAITLLHRDLDEPGLALPLLKELSEQAKTEKEAALIANLGGRIGAPFLQVKASKWLLQSGLVTVQAGWPSTTPPKPSPLPVELMHAIARQESEFRTDAVSHAGARGLMQLMPATAKKVARQVDVPYSQSQLFDPAYNMRLGSTYLAEMIDKFNGSYILAIAAYNAGQWVARFGHPGGNLESALRFMELIPFSETRNYVQRVMENHMVYQSMLNPRQVQPLSSYLTR